MSTRINTMVLIAALLLQVSAAEAMRNNKKGWGKRAKAAVVGVLAGAMVAQSAAAWTIPPFYSKNSKDGKKGSIGIGLDFSIGNIVFDFQAFTRDKKGAWNFIKSLEYVPKDKISSAIKIDGVSVGPEGISVGGLEISGKTSGGKKSGLFVTGPTVTKDGLAVLETILGDSGAKNSKMVFGTELYGLTGGDNPLIKATAGAREKGLHVGLTVGGNNNERGYKDSYGVYSKTTLPLPGKSQVEVKAASGVFNVFGSSIVVPVVPTVEVSER